MPDTRSSSRADEVGSTEKIIKTIAAAPAGTKWVVGTELNLVRRLGQQFPEQQISFLEKNVCYCSTMNRIDLPTWSGRWSRLVEGRSSTRSVLTPDVAHHARIALDQMLALPGETQGPGGPRPSLARPFARPCPSREGTNRGRTVPPARDLLPLDV